MKWILFILMIILNGCMKISPDIGDLSGSKSRLADEISRKVCIQLKKEKDLYPFGSGGEMMHEIKMLHLAFKYYKPIEIEDARELLLAAGNLFLDSINEEKKIHAYLFNYPFKPENIEIVIFINKPDGSEFEQGKLSVISMKKGILNYKVHLSTTNRLTIIHTESYEEAKTTGLFN